MLTNARSAVNVLPFVLRVLLNKEISEGKTLGPSLAYDIKIKPLLTELLKAAAPIGHLPKGPSLRL